MKGGEIKSRRKGILYNTSKKGDEKWFEERTNWILGNKYWIVIVFQTEHKTCTLRVLTLVFQSPALVRQTPSLFNTNLVFSIRKTWIYYQVFCVALWNEHCHKERVMLCQKHAFIFKPMYCFLPSIQWAILSLNNWVAFSQLVNTWLEPEFFFSFSFFFDSKKISAVIQGVSQRTTKA